MKIKHTTGDLRYLPMDIVVHQANCFTTMGAGIAASLAKEYPQVRRADNEYVLHHLQQNLPREALLGLISTAKVYNKTYNTEMLIINVYSQFHYKHGENATKVEAITQAFQQIKTKIIHEYESTGRIVRIGVPALYGAGLANGDPVLNQKAMTDALMDCLGVELYFVDFVSGKNTLD